VGGTCGTTGHSACGAGHNARTARGRAPVGKGSQRRTCSPGVNFAAVRLGGGADGLSSSHRPPPAAAPRRRAAAPPRPHRRRPRATQPCETLQGETPGDR